MEAGWATLGGMDVTNRGQDKVARLIEKGVRISAPCTVDIGDEVDLSRISGDDVVIYPGCRVYGAQTVISAGARLGAEGPVTVEDCYLGPKVELKGGYVRQSVFLEKAGMGSGAHVREGCLLEEEASGAHCVGLKQTILLPFVTLGSLVNFCDCLMTGGTDRTNHSEVGSSYIHFNYTPDGDKCTPSLFGDVARGVMLDQPPIFLGGQGGAAGPVHVGMGTVIVAGCILREDILEDRRLVVVGPHREAKRRFIPRSYGNLARLVRSNVIYLANLVALEQWYRAVRQPFFDRQEFGPLVYGGAVELLAGAKEERMKRLKAMALKVPDANRCSGELRENLDAVGELFTGSAAEAAAAGDREGAADAFLSGFAHATAGETSYIKAVKSLTPALSAQGVQWLQQTVDTLCMRADALMPSLGICAPGKR
jgi:bifunctional UDP-N-acetylglucosamine pyrophosphorylase/glucosamine-1-phosphate N-acetyltransferase